MALVGVVNLVVPKASSEMANGVASGLTTLQVCIRNSPKPVPSSLMRGRVNIKTLRKK